MSGRMFYGEDLAYVHRVGFEGLARGAAREILRRLGLAQTPIRHVVDAGCGAGPLSAALTEAGFEVTGIDASAELVALAQARAPRARFIHGSIYEVEMPRCEAVVALGEPLTYHAEGCDAEALVAKFFHSASATMPPG